MLYARCFNKLDTLDMQAACFITILQLSVNCTSIESGQDSVWATEPELLWNVELSFIAQHALRN